MAEKRTSRREWIAKTGSALAAAAVAPGVTRRASPILAEGELHQSAPPTSEQDTTRARRMAWWHDARFGMFIHWGLYSVLGRHEWVMENEGIPVSEYAPLAKQFKPKPFPAREWAKLARETGMRYMVMTTKHHEGFCHFNTKTTDYCSP